MKDLLNSHRRDTRMGEHEDVWSGPGSMLDPDFLSALGHPARLQALVLFEQRPASARELAALVDLSPSATLYHVRKLRDAGLIEQVDSRQRRAFVERVWRTSTTGWADVERMLTDVAARTP
ncbi:winged helix-turn-helix domain-containing protein [Baekduia sp.]|uniref:ArsR/SmtB family transcription factor n=1 Tax=Baekduia sp. TaxID=2600305 RepID=UPI002DFA793E|nr:winged helix-turn-helix domain-containing protein [Baekduia sp.]